MKKATIMKYLLSLTLGFILSTAYVNAQMAIKPSVGINFTDFSQDPATGEYKSKVGYQIGGAVAFGKKWYVEPGIFYVQKTVTYETSTSGLTEDDFKISGIRVPVNVGFTLIGNEKSFIGLRVFGGGSAFFLTSEKTPTNEEINNATFGLHAGVGVDLSIVFVEGSYEWSLTNIQKDVSTIDVGKSRSLFIHAGIRIPIGDK